MVTNTAKALSIAILLLLIQGCKIILIAPAGGSIESLEGNNCPSGSTCEINIEGVPFSDTFTAIPDEGYKFVAWKKESGTAYLCGESTEPCKLNGLTPSLTIRDVSTYLEPIFAELDLLDLLPAATRGVFQVYPGQPGAIDLSVMAASWSLGPLQILDQYSAGMDIAGAAERLVVAQLADTPNQFLLLAELGTENVGALSAGAGLTNPSTYQGYSVWDINSSGLQLALIDSNTLANSHTLAIGPGPALQQALDAYTSTAEGIESGPLSSYLGALTVDTTFANSFVYGLPALYGTVAAPGTGDTSLSQAYAVNSVFNVDGDTLTGPLNFFSTNAATYRTKLLEQLAGDYTTPTIIAFGETASINLNGISVENDLRPLLKTLILDMDNVDYAAAMTHGGNPPWLNFTVGEAPNSIFINFEFTGPAERAAFEAAYLPVGFSLAPIRIIDGETPRYYLVLNMYQSGGGLVSGARAEWSVFVDDPDTDEPRFLVVQAVADSIAADSVNLLTFPEPVTHVESATAIESYVGEVDEGTQIESEIFSSTIAWPQSSETLMSFDRQFVASNDYIFWLNGVADRGLYNSSVFNREGILVAIDNASQFTFDDNTVWGTYTNDEPVHALVYRNPLDIVISPWWNLDETYLDIILEAPGADPTRTQLIDFKNGFYPNLVQGNAQSAIRGEGLALSSATIGDSVPNASYHFLLHDPIGLLTHVGGPGVYTPITVELFDGEAAGHYLTLSVYRREGDTCGTRAEWVTYVAGDDGRPEMLRLDTIAAESCLDPVSLMTLAANVEQSHIVAMNKLQTTINSPFIRFDASVDLSVTDDAQAGLNWLESGDRVCSLNNICDEFYIDGQLLIETAMRAESIAIQVNTIATPWDTYIDAGTVRAGVRLTPAIQAMNPWRTLRSFAAESALP